MALICADFFFFLSKKFIFPFIIWKWNRLFWLCVIQFMENVVFKEHSELDYFRAEMTYRWNVLFAVWLKKKKKNVEHKI